MRPSFFVITGLELCTGSDIFLTFALHLLGLKRLHKRPPVGIASRVSFLTKGKMPKVKTNSSAKKRFKVTGTGKITHQKSFKRHILTKKSKKRKRAMRIDGLVAKPNMDFVKRLLRLK